jgi:F0F1-type ATP synthase membrane subunit a
MPLPCRFPAMSRVSFPYVLAIFTFVIFHYVAIRHKGIASLPKGDHVYARCTKAGIHFINTN